MNMKLSKLCFRGSLLFFAFGIFLFASLQDVSLESVPAWIAWSISIIGMVILPVLGLFFLWIESFLKSKRFSTLCFGLSPIMFLLAGILSFNKDLFVGMASIGTFLFFPIGVISRINESYERFASLPPEKQERILQSEQRARENTTIVSVTLLDAESTQTTSPSHSRTRLYNTKSIFGHPYMIARTVTKPGKTTITPTSFTFLVEYASGRQEIETVKYKSLRYNMLIKHL